MRLQNPDLPVYPYSRCSPASVAASEKRHGGNGDIWIADGYGVSHVHRYDKSGTCVLSIAGEEGFSDTFNWLDGVPIDERAQAAHLTPAVECAVP